MEDNASCRILLVPSSKDLGLSLIKRITNEKAASILQGTESTDDDQATVENDETQESTHDQDYIPWQISNKYYTADIHFQLADWNTLSPSLKSGIPAIVVIWEKGEDYTAILGRYALEWERLRPEVLLAVTTGSQDIDREKVENFCSEVGFEFIDADADVDSEDGSDDDGIPRVMEALQTIMWPSMLLKTKPKRESYTRGHRSQQSIDRGDKVAENTTVTESGTGTGGAATIPRKTYEAEEAKHSLEKEKQKLEAWLGADDDPWPKRGDASTSNPSTALDPTPASFDDDFTEFVSAPANAHPNPSATSDAKPQNDQLSDDEEDEDKFHFEDEDAGYKELFDEEMPTSEEIMLSSQRIFGPAFSGRGEMEKTGEPGEMGEEDDPGEFDLGSIMGALQNMKDEIAAMPDEDTKRRAAATVALGLVWGLEGGRH